MVLFVRIIVSKFGSVRLRSSAKRLEISINSISIEVTTFVYDSPDPIVID